MKKWLAAILVAALGAGVGCETSDTPKAESQEARSEASSSTNEGENAPEANAPEGEEQAQQDESKQASEDHDHGAKHGQAALPDDLAEGESGAYGADVDLPGEPIALADALAQAADGQGPYKVAGAIEKVCQKKGCWFTLAGEDVEQPVRVRMKDYGFFVPRNADGAEVVVEGMLEKRVVPQEEAQHYADDEAAGTDKAPEKIEQDQVQWEMTITAAEISKG